MTAVLLLLLGIAIGGLIGLGGRVAVLADQVEQLRVDLEHHTDPRTIMRKVEGIRRAARARDEPEVAEVTLLDGTVLRGTYADYVEGQLDDQGTR